MTQHVGYRKKLDYAPFATVKSNGVGSNPVYHAFPIGAKVRIIHKFRNGSIQWYLICVDGKGIQQSLSNYDIGLLHKDCLKLS